jgi:hypothetical protein
MDEEKDVDLDNIPAGIFRSGSFINGKFCAVVCGIVVEESTLGAFYKACLLILEKCGITF